MKKRDRIAKKRAKMWRAADTKERERRRQRRKWGHYRPWKNMTRDEIKAELKESLIRNLTAPNPIYAALKKLSAPAMEGFDSQNCAVAVVIGNK